jgi:hypothetical protein
VGAEKLNWNENGKASWRRDVILRREEVRKEKVSAETQRAQRSAAGERAGASKKADPSRGQDDSGVGFMVSGEAGIFGRCESTKG